MLTPFFTWLFGTVFGWMTVAALVVGVIWLINRRTGRAIFSYGRAQVGKVGRAIDEADPIGRLQQLADDAKEEIKNHKKNLAKCEAMRLSLESQVAEGRKNVARMEASLSRMFNEGKANDDPALVARATALRDEKQRLEENEKQLKQTVELFENNMKTIKAAVNKISGAEAKAKQLNGRLKLSETQRELNEMFANYGTGSLNSTLGEFERFEQLAEEKIRSNQATLNVNAALGASPIEADDPQADADVGDLIAELRNKHNAGAAAPAAQ